VGIPRLAMAAPALSGAAHVRCGTLPVSGYSIPDTTSKSRDAGAEGLTAMRERQE
jgi:hypothetical protein